MEGANEARRSGERMADWPTGVAVGARHRDWFGVRLCGVILRLGLVWVCAFVVCVWGFVVFIGL